MKKKIENLKNKTKNFVRKNETELKLYAGYVVGVTVAFTTMSYLNKRDWDQAEERFADRPEGKIIVRERNGRFGCFVPNEED